MKDKTKSILIAISFIVAMVLFIWGFNFLKGKSLLNNQYKFYAVYDNSKGLLPGNLVTINGMQVGTVSALDFHPKKDGTIIVEFLTSKELDIPANSVVNLTSSLTGSVSLDIIIGDSEELAASGDTLTSAYDNGTMGMIAETIIPLKNKLETLLVSVNELTTNLNDMLSTQTNSSIAYSKNWAGTPFSMSMNLAISQNSQTKAISGTLPNISFNVSKFFPLKRKVKLGKDRWYEKISMSYSAKLTNSVQAKESDIFSAETLKNSSIQ